MVYKESMLQKYNIQYTLHSIQYTVYTQYSMQYTLYKIYYVACDRLQRLL